MSAAVFYAARTNTGGFLRIKLAIFTTVLAGGFASTPSGAADRAGLQIEIQSPAADFVAIAGEKTVDIEGVASNIGGVRYLDMMFVMDTSSSLRNTDPRDFRSAGAVGLVENLSPGSDIKIGVVNFDNKGELAQPMTSDRTEVIRVLRN